MKLTKLFVIFSSILLLNSSLSTNITFKPSIDSQTLYKSICKITNDITSSKSDTKDILIGNLGGKIWSSTINNIVQCIDDETAVVVTDLQNKMSRNNLKKALLIIVAFDSIDGVSIKNLSRRTDPVIF